MISVTSSDVTIAQGDAEIQVMSNTQTANSNPCRFNESDYLLHQLDVYENEADALLSFENHVLK